MIAKHNRMTAVWMCEYEPVTTDSVRILRIWRDDRAPAYSPTEECYATVEGEGRIVERLRLGRSSYGISPDSATERVVDVVNQQNIFTYRG